MSSIIINVDTALADVPIIEIGKQGENEATQVVFDVSDMIDTFGSGTAYVVVQRRGDAEPYLLDNTQQSSDKVTWTVSNVDTDVYGMGRVQLFWLIDDQVAKSVNYQFYVEEALGNPTDAPVVPGGWISEKIGDLDELTTTAKENLVAAINEVNALVVDMADDVEGLSADVETLQTQMETKAEIDGLYEDMTVGNAEQLIASDYFTDKAPYLFRKTGGATDVGNREYDTLVGASAVWNQLVNSTDTSVTVQSGHKYLSKISGAFAIGSSDGTAITVDGASGDMVVDITKFFGSATIPDYVYTLEQSTSGSGVAWLRQYFPKLFEYHEYDAGTLKSVEGVESHDTVGFNAYNPTTGKAKVLSGNQYQITGAYTALSLEGTTITPDSSGLFTPTVTGELTVTGGNNSTTCIHLVNSGYRTGEYEPYWKRSYPLDSTWVGRGIYKLGSDGKPYADGDRYASDGSGEVRYGEYTFTGSETWGFASTFFYFLYDFGGLKHNGSCIASNGIVTRLNENPQGLRVYLSDNPQLSSESDMSALFKSGTKAVYEKATPTTAEYEPFQSPQICDDFGTEEYVTDCLIPIGHETKYPANLRDKVQHLPDLSNLGNGNYIINQSGTQMSLIPTTSIIPAVPTTNGTYKLKCTVSGGQATLTWEVE